MKFLEKNILPFALLLAVVACKKSAPAEAVPDNVFYTCSMDPQVMEKKRAAMAKLARPDAADDLARRVFEKKF